MTDQNKKLVVKTLNTTIKIADKDREYPSSHLIQILCFFGFLSVWFLDTFIIKLSIGLSTVIPLFMRLIVFLIIFVIALRLIQLAHNSLFNNQPTETPVEHEQHHPGKLIESGIMAYVRHPMYLGTLLVYLAFVGLTLSISSFVLWIGIFVIYDTMASFEERRLENMFGEAYIEYKIRVPKWISFDLFSAFKLSEVEQ
ncbi:MAG: methyltransferase family protein [Candidatus Hodarchaeales archaeon]